MNTILDMGNDFCDYEIYLNKSGYVDREAKIELKYEADLIDSIFDDKDDIIVLPQSCIILNDELIIMKDAQSFCKTEFKFCINEIKKIQNDNPGKQLLLPVKLYLHNDNNEIVLSEGKDYIIFDLSITEPFAELKNKGSVIPISIDRFRNPGIENVAFPIEINLPFENSKYEFEFSYKVDPLLLDEYNEKFGTSYELLPSGYVLPTLKIEAEEQSCKGNIIINCAEFPLSVGGTEYLLPIVITDSGNELIPMQEGSVCYFLIKFKSKWSGSWKNMVHDGESGVSTTPGTVYDTYLYSRKDALEQIKDYTVVTAFSIIQDEDAILCPGWAGTMFEQ